MPEREAALLSGRVKRMRRLLGRTLGSGQAGSAEPLGPEERGYLLDQARELYWNELEWEKLTGEELIGREFFSEMAFPGTLAFVRGLLLEEARPDSPAPARPRPQVVEDFLLFLAGRVVELEEETSGCEGEEREVREGELQMTSRLVDLVLYRLFGLGPEEVDRIEAASLTE